ncbi:MAG: hypothetical protein ABIP08_05880 [Lautropia sp.]
MYHFSNSLPGTMRLCPWPTFWGHEQGHLPRAPQRISSGAFAREVGLAAARAMHAFGERRYVDTVRLLRPIRHQAHRFGGSHAQRDVIDLTLIEAAIRAGRRTLTTALSQERLARRPESPLAQLFVRRAAAMPALKAT